MIFSATANARMVSMDAKIIRADGRVEELGTIAYWHRNPLKRMAWHVSRFVRRVLLVKGK